MFHVKNNKIIVHLNVTFHQALFKNKLWYLKLENIKFYVSLFNSHLKKHSNNRNKISADLEAFSYIHSAVKHNDLTLYS